MASRQQNDSMAGLLKQTLAQGAPANDTCLGPELMAAYFDCSLAPDERKVCETHLSRCSTCREQLAAMLRAEEPQAVPSREAEPRRTWLLDWRWLAAAATVAVLIAVWLAHKPEQPVRVAEPANAPLVAMNQPEPPASNPHPADKSRSGLERTRPSPPRETREHAEEPRVPEMLAKKVPPSAARSAKGFATLPPGLPREKDQTQTADSIMATNQVSNAPPSKRDRKQSGPLAQSGSAGARAFVMPRTQQQQGQMQQQNEVSQTITVTQARQLQRQEAAAAAPPAVPAVSATGGVLAGNAQPNAALDDAAKNKKEIGAPPAAQRLLTQVTTAEVQAVERRSSGNIIPTLNPKVKWRFDTSGFVERSTDGGATWNGQQVDSQGGLRAGSALNDKICWVVGRGGAVYVTKDGLKWTPVKAPDSADLVEVSAKSASSATVATADGRQFSTQDRGKKWKLESRGPDSNPH